MEEAAGTQLGKIWNDMEIDSKPGIVEAIPVVERRLVSLSFTRFGLTKKSTNTANERGHID